MYLLATWHMKGSMNLNDDVGKVDIGLLQSPRRCLRLRLIWKPWKSNQLPSDGCSILQSGINLCPSIQRSWLTVLGLFQCFPASDSPWLCMRCSALLQLVYQIVDVAATRTNGNCTAVSRSEKIHNSQRCGTAEYSFGIFKQRALDDCAADGSFWPDHNQNDKAGHAGRSRAWARRSCHPSLAGV